MAFTVTPEQMRNVAETVKTMLPPGYAFAVVAIPFGGPDVRTMEWIYVSNSERGDIEQLFKDFLALRQQRRN
jgi:hypothetical protein